MATILKTKYGWQAQVARRVNGKSVRKSQTFKYLRDAESWAREFEGGLSSGTTSSDTIAQVFDRYARDRSAKKPGEKWEKVRLNRFKRDLANGKPLGDYLICDITRADLVEWRDLRLEQVKPDTVRREMNLLKHVFATATEEWQLIAIDPAKKVNRPPKGERRERRPSPEEIEQLCTAFGLDQEPWESREQIVGAMFLFAIETGMRSGEMRNMKEDHIEGFIIRIPKSKNGSARKTPMTPRAREILAKMPKGGPFNIDADKRDTTFRKVRDRLKIKNLHFHDTRHEAITRLAQIIKPLGLARMVGHKNLNELLTYYEQSDEDVASIVSASTSNDEIR